MIYTLQAMNGKMSFLGLFEWSVLNLESGAHRLKRYMLEKTEEQSRMDNPKKLAILDTGQR